MGSKWSRVLKEDTVTVPIHMYDMVDLEAERLAKEAAEKTAEPIHDCSQLQQEAFESGKQKGMDQGRREVLSPAEALTRQALDVTSQVERVRVEEVRQAESDIVELALAIAHKVILHEATIDKDMVLNQVRQIVGQIDEKGLVRLRVHPDDRERLEQVRTTITGSDGKPVRLQIEEDPDLQIGGVVLESNQYFIDASIATQLDEMWRELMEPDDQTESLETRELDPSSED